MKHILLILICVVFTCNAQQNQKQGYVIQGKVTNFKDSTLLVLNNVKLNKIVDSTYVINGEFKLTGIVDHPERFTLTTRAKNVNDFRYTFFWIENTTLNLTGDFEDFRYAKVSGSELNRIDYERSIKRSVFEKKRDSIVKIFRKGTTNKEHRESLSNALKSIDSITTKLDLEFVRTKPNNLVALETLTFLKDKFPKEELNKIYSSLDDNLKQSDNGKSIKTYLSIDKILEKGDYIMDIEGKNIEGESKTLASIVKQNKYTILDFWAAGCGPCRMQSKQYVELYKKYHSKGLEIVSFSLDKNKKHWVAASKKDNITWVNISDLKGNLAKTPMSYGVRGIPNSFLINQEGKIIAEFNGFNSQKAPFETELADFLTNKEPN